MKAVVLCLVCACGGPTKPVEEPRPAEPPKLSARPAPPEPYEVRARELYRPTERCGQGPYHVETESLRATYGERMIVVACGRYAIRGNYRLTTTRKGQAATTDEAAFGTFRDNEACMGREVRTATSATSTALAPAGGGARGRAGVSSAAPATIKPVTLERATTTRENCVRTQLVDITWTAPEDRVAIDAHVALDFWSDEPNDLAELVLIVEQRAVVPDMTLERWRAHRKAEDARFAAAIAKLDAEVRAGRASIVDRTARSPPPPPPRAETQPPRPSRNARWIPGYWHYDAARFHWIAGLWEVPDDDIRQALTVQVATPPPAPTREQPTEARPTETAVWTPGSWQWDGRAYVWIAGTWRIPPDAQHVWQPTTWMVRPGRAILVPGGWRIRVRPRR